MSIQIKSAEYVISNSDVKKCPEGNIPEYAFIGRSNVGKSSLLNILVGENKVKGQVINSMVTLKKVYPILKEASDRNEKIWIKIE